MPLRTAIYSWVQSCALQDSSVWVRFFFSPPGLAIASWVKCPLLGPLLYLTYYVAQSTLFSSCGGNIVHLWDVIFLHRAPICLTGRHYPPQGQILLTSLIIFFSDMVSLLEIRQGLSVTYGSLIANLFFHLFFCWPLRGLPDPYLVSLESMRAIRNHQQLITHCQWSAFYEMMLLQRGGLYL